MMILNRVLTWIRSLPSLRGREAVRAYVIAGAAIIILGGALALAYNFFFLSGGFLMPGSTATQSGTKAPQEARDVAGPIDGLLFTATEAKTWQSRPPLAVVIENHVDARPQSGFSQADLVYESLAEGGITRTLSLFLTNLAPVTVGPIRSMRIYFLDWLEEYGALAAHVGGNAVAIARIGPEKVKDLDQFYNGSFYDRTNDRPAPHNVYTNTDRLWAAGAQRGYTGASTFRSWPFKAEATASARPSNQTLRLGFLGDPNYKVDWTYSQEANTYLRSIGGADAVDRNNSQRISAKTVVVEVIGYHTGLSYPGDPAASMDDIGTGKAYVFTDGVVTPGTWNKSSRTDRTIFKDSTGAEIPFNRGPIWIEVVPPNTPVEY